MSDDLKKFPLFEAIYGLVLELERLRLRYPKRLKYSLGERLSMQSLTAMERAVAAVVDPDDRLSHLKGLITSLETLRFLVRLSHDFQAIDSKQYGRLSEQIVDALWQAVGFLKSTKSSAKSDKQPSHQRS